MQPLTLFRGLFNWQNIGLQISLMKKLLYLFLFWLIVSCEKEEVKPQITVDSVILIEVQEVVASGKNYLVLKCETEKIYNCANYALDVTQVISKNNFSVNFTGMNTDDICATGLGPAKNNIILGALESPTYSLALNVNGFQNKGTLTITNTQILLNFPQQNGIQILNPVYTR